MRNNKYALHSLVTCVLMIVMSVILTIAIIECTTFSYAIESVDEDTIKQDENSKIIKPKSSVIANAEEDESGTLIINEHSLEVFVNSTKTLQTTFHSEDENDYILWSSSNEEIATVNQNGTVKAVGSGSCIIRAESKLFGFYDECEVKVDSSMSKCKITIPYKEKIYSGRSYKPTVTIKDPQGRKIQKSSYSVQYLNNKEIGKATVTVTGIAPYKGTIKKTFIIKPKKGVIKKISADYKKASLKIKNAGGDVYYQIKYRKSGKNWHYKKIGKKLDKTVTKLANRKYYYFSVRPYKKVNGVTYYGKWSRTKKVQIGISIKKCKIKGITNKIYNGKKKKHNIRVYYKGKRIKVGIVYGKNRRSIGTRYITIYGKGKFVGKVKKHYYIWPGRTQITGMCPYEWYDYDIEDPRYDYIDDEADFYIKAVDLKCKKIKGNVKYQFAFKWEGSKWKYCTYGKDRSVCWFDFPKNKVIFAKVRAYKKVGKYYYFGDWSSISKETSKNKKIRFNSFYRSNNYIKGYVKNAYKGEIIKIKIGKKVYKKKIKRSSSKYRYKIYVGHHKEGKKIKAQLLTRFKETIWTHTDRVWYASDLKKGMTRHQARNVPGWESPNDYTYSGSYEYWWYDDDGDGWDLDSYLIFYKGRLKDWVY